MALHGDEGPGWTIRRSSRSAAVVAPHVAYHLLDSNACLNHYDSDVGGGDVSGKTIGNSGAFDPERICRTEASIEALVERRVSLKASEMSNPNSFSDIRSAKPLTVAIDDRPGWIRIAIADGGDFEFRDRVVLPADVSGSLPDFATEGASYSVVAEQNARLPMDLLSCQHRVLVHHALMQAGLGGRALQVISTLPSLEYFSGSDGRENLGLIAAKSNNLSAAVRSAGSVPAAQIRASYVFAQGVSAWVDYSIDKHGVVSHNLGSAAAVVEIGSNQTYCTTVLPGYRADRGRCGVIELGYRHLCGLLVREIRRQFGISDLPSDVVIKAVQTGFLEHSGRVYEIRASVASAKAEFADSLQHEVVRRLGAPDEFYRLVFVGPGAALLPQLRDLAVNAEVPPEPLYAGSRGLIKYVRHLV
jgi:plasmid segregation protein ParM